MVSTPLTGPSYSVLVCVVTQASMAPLFQQACWASRRARGRRCTRRWCWPCRDGRAAVCRPARPGVGRPGLREPAVAPLRAVVEPPDARVGAEVVVEGPVLLHQEDDVLDGADVGTGRLDRAAASTVARADPGPAQSPPVTPRRSPRPSRRGTAAGPAPRPAVRLDPLFTRATPASPDVSPRASLAEPDDGRRSGPGCHQRSGLDGPLGAELQGLGGTESTRARCAT